MRILIAGSTGAIGRPLIRYLKENGHAVFALARSPQSARAVAELGGEPVAADALDATSVTAAIVRVLPDAVINELTSLPRHYTAAEMKAAAERDYKVRTEGNANLLVALQNAGVRRYLLQSSGFWYAPGVGLADENERFAFDASPAVAASARTYAELEAAASGTLGIDFVSLRYGFFYGRAPGTAAKATWANRSASSRFRSSATERVSGASCTSMMPPQQRRPPWNPHRVPTTSWTAIRHLRACGYRHSHARSARQHHHKRRKKKP
jgi:nucleoside-diphosphate-sugar epimerase